MNTIRGTKNLLRRVAQHLDSGQEDKSLSHVLMCLRKIEDEMLNVQQWIISARTQTEGLESGEAEENLRRIQQAADTVVNLSIETRRNLA